MAKLQNILDCIVFLRRNSLNTYYSIDFQFSAGSHAYDITSIKMYVAYFAA